MILLRADKNRKSLVNRQKCLNYSPQHLPPNKPFFEQTSKKTAVYLQYLYSNRNYRCCLYQKPL